MSQTVREIAEKIVNGEQVPFSSIVKLARHVRNSCDLKEELALNPTGTADVLASPVCDWLKAIDEELSCAETDGCICGAGKVNL